MGAVAPTTAPVSASTGRMRLATHCSVRPVLVRTEFGGTVDLPAEMLVSEAVRRHAGAAERLSVRVTWRWERF